MEIKSVIFLSSNNTIKDKYYDSFFFNLAIGRIFSKGEWIRRGPSQVKIHSELSNEFVLLRNHNLRY